MNSIVTVGIGNTSVSAADFSPPSGSPTGFPKPRSVWRQSIAQLDLASLLAWAPNAPRSWVIGSVNRQTSRQLCDWLRQTVPREVPALLDHGDFPLPLEVDTPRQVGVDRLAAALACNAVRDPAKPAIVIDVGSAVTIDVVSSQGVFQGGLIFPGIQLGLDALASGTDLLPKTSVDDRDVVHIGKNTADAMQAGVHWATLEGIRGIVRRLEKLLGQDCEIFATGGGLRRLRSQLGSSVRHEPNLVLIGLLMARLSQHR